MKYKSAFDPEVLIPIKKELENGEIVVCEIRFSNVGGMKLIYVLKSVEQLNLVQKLWKPEAIITFYKPNIIFQGKPSPDSLKLLWGKRETDLSLSFLEDELPEEHYGEEDFIWWLFQNKEKEIMIRDGFKENLSNCALVPSPNGELKFGAY